jgi:hypothetical protein
MPLHDLGGEGTPLLEYRVTKYDPRYRDARGAYRRNEWTSVADVGRAFDGVVLTREEYDCVESAYVESALAFVRESGVSNLNIAGLETHRGFPFRYQEGTRLFLDEAGEVLRRVLREEVWCRLEAPAAFVHVGYDYYMYVGVARLTPLADQLARRLGLVVEPFKSPYRHNDE